MTFLCYALFLFVGALEVLNGEPEHSASSSPSPASCCSPTDRSLTAARCGTACRLVTVLLGRLHDVFEQEPEQGHDHSALRPVPTLEGHIRLRRVGFAYPTAPDRPILRDINLDVPAGTTVAIVGRSRLGQVDAREAARRPARSPPRDRSSTTASISPRCDFSELRRRIGFVLQEPYLFDDTIEANIAFGEQTPIRTRSAGRPRSRTPPSSSSASRSATRRASARAGCGSRAGQAQRVAIARAVYHQPPVLHLRRGDERARHGVRARGQAEHGPAARGTHVVRDRPSPVDDPRRRSDLRARAAGASSSTARTRS